MCIGVSVEGDQRKMENDKWMDEIFEKTEKEHIHQKVRYAIECIRNLDVSEALETLEELVVELGTEVETISVSRLNCEQKELDRVKAILSVLGIQGHSGYHNHSHGRGAYTYTYTETEFVGALRQEFEELRRALHDLQYVNREVLRGLIDMVDFLEKNG